MQDIIIDIATSIAQDGVVRANGVGYFPTKPMQYRDFRMLLVLAEEGDLVDLTNHDSPVVRCYAFWGLVETMSKQSEKILHHHKHDMTPVKTQMFGCVVHTTSVAQFMKHLYAESIRKRKAPFRLKTVLKNHWNTFRRRFYRQSFFV